MPLKMNPIEPAAGTAVLVGDPRRAFALAQELTVQPRMTHQARGLWGYQGLSAGGLHLTVQSTGSGGPAAAAVIADLAAQGASRFVRLGSCLALDPDLSAGALLKVSRAIGRDGTSRALGCGDCALPDRELSKALDRIGTPTVVSSHDLVGRIDPEGARQEGPLPVAAARDLQTAAVLTMSRRLDIPAVAFLIVADDVSGHRLDEKALWKGFREVGREVVGKLERLESD